MTTRMVLRWEVPVDDQWHVFTLSGSIVHVATRRLDVVEFWSLEGDDVPGRHDRRFRVFGTGQPLPAEARRHIGTALAGQLVWHLFEGPMP